MSVESDLLARSGGRCELCGSPEVLKVYEIPPGYDGSVEQSLMVCDHCLQQIENPELVDVNHWRCLNDSMWSQIPAVQVMVWRMLTRLSAEGWPQGLLDMLYLDDDVLVWAKSNATALLTDDGVQYLDAHGAQLQAGDTVTLVKDLTVKGANFTAKRGTAVRGISLVHDNAEQIEGRVNGQQIVILTKFVKKSA